MAKVPGHRINVGHIFDRSKIPPRIDSWKCWRDEFWNYLYIICKILISTSLQYRKALWMGNIKQFSCFGFEISIQKIKRWGIEFMRGLGSMSRMNWNNIIVYLCAFKSISEWSNWNGNASLGWGYGVLKIKAVPIEVDIGIWISLFWPSFLITDILSKTKHLLFEQNCLKYSLRILGLGKSVLPYAKVDIFSFIFCVVN